MLSQLRANYLAFNPNRDYAQGDKIIMYDNCASNIVLYQNVNPGRKEKFLPQDWNEIEGGKEPTGMNICGGYKAEYLGACIKNIILKNISLGEILYRPDLILLNSEPEIYFDNITFI